MPVKITYKNMPHMMPVPMETKSKGLVGGIILWLTKTRTWEITEDWKFGLQMDGQKTVTSFMIPKGFVFDGASVPKPLRSWLSPMGVLLSGGLVHDYVYKFETLRLSTKKAQAITKKDQKWADMLFRDICIDVNGFKLINYLAYYALRLGGWLAWNGHRKRNVQWDD